MKKEERKKKAIKKSQKKKSNRASMLLQGILLVIFFIFFFWVTYKPISHYNPNESYRPVVALTPSKVIAFGGHPTTVNVGLYIQGFPEFDITRDKFVADLTVWFRFNPRQISLKRISKFSFEKATILQKTQTHAQIEGDILFVRYFMRISFNTKLNFQSFPLDDHRLNISLTHQGLSPSEAIFKTSRTNLTINPEVRISGWKLVDKTARSGYIEDKLDPYAKGSNVYYPMAVFSLDFARTGIRHIITIIIPLILIFFIALLTFTFDPTRGEVIGVSVGSVSAVIAHRFVIERLSPDPGYLMISDQVFLLALVGCSTVLMVNILGKKLTGTHKNIITFIAHLLFIAVFLYLFLPIS